MFSLKQKFILLIFGAFVLVAFQNCSNVDFNVKSPQDISDAQSNAGNGDGYSGMDIIHPKTITVFEAATLEIYGDGPFEYELVQETPGRIDNVFEGDEYTKISYVPADTEEEYTARIKITDVNEVFNIVEIKVTPN